MSKVRILAVGIGGYANVYLESLLASENKNFEIVGMVDVFPQGCRFLDTLKEMGVPLYADMESFYKEHSADLCIITTPIFLHTRQILTALKNGSHVMCEKPLSGVSEDEKIINDAANKAGKFVMIGYQWSYSEAIGKLKVDIMSGKFGKPISMKTIVLWPRPRDYFTRGGGWGGKIAAADGTLMYDSIANNAAAHYLHNMLYLLGDKTDKSAEALNVDCSLFRANDIENFDTAEITFETEKGCKCVFLATHATEKLLDPVFEYTFENGKVVFGEEFSEITAFMNNGEKLVYGNPFKDVNEKIYKAIEYAANNQLSNECSVTTAAAHTRCIEAVQKFPINTVSKDKLAERENFVYVKGLYEEMTECFKTGRRFKDSEYYRWLVNDGN